MVAAVEHGTGGQSPRLKIVGDEAVDRGERGAKQIWNLGWFFSKLFRVSASMDRLLGVRDCYGIRGSDGA